MEGVVLLYSEKEVEVVDATRLWQARSIAFLLPQANTIYFSPPLFALLFTTLMNYRRAHHALRSADMARPNDVDSVRSSFSERVCWRADVASDTSQRSI